MNTNRFILIIIIILIASFSTYWFFFRTDNVPPPDTGSPLGGPPIIPGANNNGGGGTGGNNGNNGGSGNVTPFPIPVGDTIIVENQFGEPLSVRNFYKDSTTDITEEGIPILHNEQTSYTLWYVPIDKSFGVSINSITNIPLARAEMESDLLAFLGITPEKACELKITVGVPAHVSLDYLRQSFGLSFCPTGTPL